MRIQRWLPAAAAGITAGVVALGVAELLSGILAIRSPVIAVGDVVIDNVPEPVKKFAIETFGENDKPALLIGIFALLSIFAMVVGGLAWRSLRLGAAALAVFAIIGVAAGAVSLDPLWRSILPAPIGALLAFLALFLMRRAAFTGRIRPGAASGEEVPSEHSTDDVADVSEGRTVPDTIDRRAFLTVTGAVLAVAVASAAGGRWLKGQMSAAASRAAVILPRPVNRLAPIPDAAAVDLAGMPPFITPNRAFYRVDTALIVPQVNTDDWVLRVTGMVDEPLSFTYEELLARPMVERYITMTCVSNVVGGDLVDNAKWLGIPLRELLDEAGVDPNRATQIVGRSVDGYSCGFPTSAAYDGRDALLAVGMNGEPLPLDHGFPARLVTAGLYGFVSATKWLTEIELTTMEAFDSYWVRRGWAKEAPIKTQSRIDVPKGFARVGAGIVTVGGTAWAQTRGVDRVEVRIDNGPWNAAELAAGVNDSTWRQWRYEWDARPGQHFIQVRAIDGEGDTQTGERAEPIPSGATGWHSVTVTVT